MNREEQQAEKTALLEQEAARRILILDGAIGTMIQRLGLGEADYRGERFADWPSPLKGDNDLLNLTRPEDIAAIHRAYFAAGADFAETNTFNANRISQADYGLQARAREMNVAGARLARAEADAWMAREPDRPRFVAGSIGPTNRTASISPDVADPGYRNVTFDELVVAYREAAEGLIEGGVDLLLIETVFDTLNAKAALYAIDVLFEELGRRLPVMVSGTITDLSGRNLSGQTVEAFWYSVRHGRLFSIGLNCSFGAEQLRPYVAELARVADTRVSAYANAGLPNAFGEYEETPERMATQMHEWAETGLLNVVGGCCGTTPQHIREIAAAVAGLPPRPIPKLPPRLRLAGLEPFELA